MSIYCWENGEKVNMQIWKRNRNQEEEKEEEEEGWGRNASPSYVGVGNFWRAQCFLRDLEQPS